MSSLNKEISNITRKKLYHILIFLMNMYYVFTIENFLSKNFGRNLERKYSSKSMYYEIKYTKNNITGTGDKLMDVPYKSLCLILNCESGCCEGEIDNLTCSAKSSCGVYRDYLIAGIVTVAVIVPICSILFVTLLTIVFIKRNGYSYIKSFLLACLCLLIIPIPYVFYYARKKAKTSEINIIIDKQKKEERLKENEEKRSKENSVNNKNDILTINKPEIKGSSKFSSSKNVEAMNEYKKIINEIDEKEEKDEKDEKEDDGFVINKENPIIKDKSINNSENFDAEDHFLTDPLQNNQKEQLITEENRLINALDDEENKNYILEENKDQAIEQEEKHEENKEQQINENKENIDNNNNPEEKKEENIENFEINENNNIPLNEEVPQPEQNAPESGSGEPNIPEESAPSMEEIKQEINENIKIIKLLPLLKTPEDAKERERLFKKFDLNVNGYLSMQEVEKGVRDIFGFNEKFLKKEVIKKAFHSAKKSGAKRSQFSESFIERNEFRTFLVFIRQYSEYYEMFDLMDKQDDKKISYDEFLEALPVLKRWGIEIEDPQTVFLEIDTNGGGKIMFDEFCQWAIEKNLDLENDDDFNDEDLAKL